MKSAFMRRTAGRRSHSGMAVIELLIAIGVLFTAAWTFVSLSAVAYQAYFNLIHPFIMWPLG